jgi:hypothetical protein
VCEVSGTHRAGANAIAISSRRDGGRVVDVVMNCATIESNSSTPMSQAFSEGRAEMVHLERRTRQMAAFTACKLA